MGFDIQATIDTAVAEGSIILLVDFQTKDFMNTTAAGIQVFLGDEPDAGRVQRLGTTRQLAAAITSTATARSRSRPTRRTNAALGGKIVSGTFTGGPGNLSLQIALGGTTPIQLDLIGARAKASAHHARRRSASAPRAA